MDLDNYLNNLGFNIYNEFKGNTIFREDILIPLNIIHEHRMAAEALYPLIHDHVKFAQLLVGIKVTWKGFLNQNLLLGIKEYERVLGEKIQQERVRGELYRLSEAHKLTTDMDEINDLIGQCSLKHSSIDALTMCMTKSGIHKKSPSKRRRKK
jgi:hypothetical protein